MKWSAESLGDVKKRLFKWHKYFAWFPVFCYSTRKIIWLGPVERKASNYSGYLQEFDFIYREIN